MYKSNSDPALTKKESEVTKEFLLLSNSVDDLTSGIGRLCEQLDPVLSVGPVAVERDLSAADSDPITTAPILSEIRDVKTRISALTARVTYLQNRLVI